MTTPQPVPFVDLVALHAEMEEELVEAFRRCLRTGAFVGGPEVEGFEQEFADYCGTKYCVGVGSGTDAVQFALMAAGVGQGDAVITVAHTFIATVEAISHAGAATEFVDIDEGTYTMSPSALAEYLDGCEVDQVSGRPLGRRSGLPIRAILPVHIYGQTADMDPLTEIAERYGLVIVEDASQAHGAEYRTERVSGAGWKRAGALGRTAAFSFYPGKNLGACGEAGAVTTDDAEAARRVRLLRDHGQERKYHHVLEGFNSRLDAVQAACLRIKLRRLDQWNSDRRAAAARYDALLAAGTAAVSSGITVPPSRPASRPVHHLYVVRTLDPQALAEHLQARGIGIGFHYPKPVHLQDCYASWGYRPGQLPTTERVAAEILSLPMSATITPEQQMRVVGAVSDYFSSVGMRA